MAISNARYHVEAPLISLTKVWGTSTQGIDVDPARIESVKDHIGTSHATANSHLKMYSGDEFYVAETREEISRLRAEAFSR